MLCTNHSSLDERWKLPPLGPAHARRIYLVNGTTGAVIWTLGGKNNDFTELPPYSDSNTHPFSNPVLSMSWQHHARFYRGGESEITLFGNHVIDYNGVGCERDCSRGIHYRIDATSEPKTVRLLNEYPHPDGMLSQSQGSVQVLDDGNVFVGWWGEPEFHGAYAGRGDGAQRTVFAVEECGDGESGAG